MNALQHVEMVRAKYVEALLESIRKAKAKGDFLASEVVMVPNLPEGQRRPPDEAADVPPFMTIDLLQGTEESPRPSLLMHDPEEGPLIGAIAAGTIEVAVFPFLWEACKIWLRHAGRSGGAGPDWKPLQEWFARWFVGNDGVRKADSRGLAGGVHYMADPIAEGGGYLFEVDLGSAPVDALLDLLRTLGEMGATDVRIGNSDGSEMDPAIADALRSPDLGPEKFVQLVVELLRELEGVEHVTVGPEPMMLHIRENGQEEPYISNLGNLWLMIQKAPPDHPPPEVSKYLRGHLESRQYRDAETKPDLSSLRPVIKPFVFIEHVRQIEENQKEKKLELVCTRLTGDIWIACVWDRPNGMQFVTSNEPEEFGLTLEETHARALKNYLASPREISTEDLGGVTVARTHDNYDASLLLDDEFWTRMAAKFRGLVLAAVPTRDAVLISSTETPGGEAALREMAREYLQSRNHAISTTVLVRRANTWQVFGKTEAAGEGVARIADATTEEAPRQVEQVVKKKPWWKFW